MNIGTRYGSKRGLVRLVGSRFIDLMGGYRDAHRVIAGSDNRLVFVCKGNICRSAFAEAVARGRGIDTASFGIDTVVGAPANASASSGAVRRGYDLSAHRTTPEECFDIEDRDILIAMEPGQYEWLRGRYSNPVTLLGLWVKPLRPYLHDPYSCQDGYFDTCFEVIEDAIDGFTKRK